MTVGWHYWNSAESEFWQERISFVFLFDATTYTMYKKWDYQRFPWRPLWSPLNCDDYQCVATNAKQTKRRKRHRPSAVIEQENSKEIRVHFIPSYQKESMEWRKTNCTVPPMSWMDRLSAGTPLQAKARLEWVTAEVGEAAKETIQS